MKCENCHQADATTAVTVKRDGAERELYVCAACAARLRGGETAPPGKDGNARFSVTGGGDDKAPPPFVADFVKATLGFIKEVAEASDTGARACPACKTKWEQVKDSGRLGCPTCWKAFAKRIRRELLAAQYGPCHLGGAPAVERLPDAESARAVLDRDLKAAIAREDYRRAAELKKRLDDLDGGKGKEAAT